MMKRAIIKKLMKLKEIFPKPDFYHPTFTEADEEERKVIMLRVTRSHYDDEFKYPWDRHFGFDLTPLLKNKVVLDLGCYTGGKTIAWAERYAVKEMYGIDSTDIYIEAARMFAKTRRLEAHFTVAFAEVLPFEDEKFDAILTSNLFEHVRSLRDVLLECKHVLRKRGMLFVTFPGYFHPFEHHLSNVTLTPFLQYFFTGKELVDAYNEIMDERGDEVNWYRRNPRDLESWERCNTINGTTWRSFRNLVKETGWNIYHKGRLPIGRVVGRVYSKKSIVKPLSYIIQPFVSLPLVEEALCQPIVYILEKP